MNFSDVLKALNQASAFELYRIRTAINRVLDEPRWVTSIQARLQVGQRVEYFDTQANTLHRGQILELRRKQVLLLSEHDGLRWLLPYAAINVDGADVEIREQKQQGLGRNEVVVGEVLGYLDRNHQQRSGRVLRLNGKTVTLQVGADQWRVGYSLLHRVVESNGVVTQAPVELGLFPYERV